MLTTLLKFFNFCNDENRRKFYTSVVLSVISSLFSALKIPAIAVILEAILNNTLGMREIFISLGIMLVSLLGSYLVKYHATMLQTEAGYGVACDKRVEIAEHMRYIPMGYFNKNSIGYIMSVTTNSMENLADIGTQVVMMVTEGIITTFMIAAMVFFFDWRIGLLILVGLAIYFTANNLVQRHSQHISARKVKSDAEIVERVIEYVRGIEEVKSYRMIGKYNKRVNDAVDRNVKANIDLEIALIPYMTLQNFVAKAIGVAITVASLYYFTSGSMILLNCIMMVICSFMIMENMETAGNYSALMRVINLSIDKAQSIMNIEAMDIEGEDITPASFDIQVNDISFSYESKRIIDHVSLTIPQNTTTAFVGPSGSGKTTLCNLISRFWDVDEGTITLGGKNIQDYSLDALMRNFSFVFQNVYLFKDTIANNIRFGKPEASMDEVIAAAKKAQCHDFIMALPQGYETVIGESGGNLSGGERQRLSIARAIMKDSPIIILDEATANVDPENERDLLLAIDELTRQKTIIMIAHRLKTVQDADQIFVVNDGKIEQSGTHQELLDMGGTYKDFVEQRNKAVSWKIQS